MSKVKRRSKLKTKVILEPFISTILVSVFIFVYFPYRQKQQLVEAVEEKAKTIATILGTSASSGLVFEDESFVKSVFSGVSAEPDLLYIATLKADGELFTSYQLSEAEGKIDYTIQGTTISGKVLNVNIPIMLGTDEIGRLVLGMSLARVHNRIRDFRLMTLNVAGLIIIIGSIFGLIIGNIMTKPVIDLTESTHKMADGDLTVSVDIKTGDELQELGEAFNVMVANQAKTIEELHAREKELSEANEKYRKLSQELEIKVEERTRELTIANKKLRQASQTKSEFLANMSHELRTPLNSIIGFSEILLEKTFGELEEKQHRYVNNIHTSGKHLLGLINDILDLSKVEAGKIELKYEAFVLEEMLSECKTLVKTMAAKKNITLGVQVEGVSSINADPMRFKQIMYNLLSNAIKFTLDSGSVDILVKQVDNDTVVAVKDTGIGIPEDQQQRIFEEFVQVDSSYSKQYKGTGLGLSLTRKLVELHGGKILVESLVDKGTTFTFTIPVTAPVEPVVEDLPVTSLNGKPTILVVEDEKQARELLSHYLTEAGYQVAYAFDGEEVVEKARKLKPLAITLDIILPRKDGFEVLKELKKIPETKDIPVIIVSIVENQELGISLGAVDYLIKPINKNELIRKLAEYKLIQDEEEAEICILVVDDNPKDVEILNSILEPEGYKVIKAYGGQEGISLALTEKPNAIILDLLMPDVSGFEVAKRLKEDPTSRDIPILIYTGADLSEEEKQSLNNEIVSITQKGTSCREDLLTELKKLETRKKT